MGFNLCLQVDKGFTLVENSIESASRDTMVIKENYRVQCYIVNGVVSMQVYIQEAHRLIGTLELQ